MARFRFSSLGKQTRSMSEAEGPLWQVRTRPAARSARFESDDFDPDGNNIEAVFRERV